MPASASSSRSRVSVANTAVADLASIPAGMVPAVVVIFATRSAVLLRYLSEFERGGLFVPGGESLPEGLQVSINIAFANELATMQSPGIVRWHRTGATKPLQTGTGIELAGDGAISQVLRKFVNAHKDFALKPRPRRVHVKYLVHAASARRFFTAHTTDISRTGMHLVCDERPAVGEIVQLRLFVPDAEPVMLLATVARHSRTGIGVTVSGVQGTDADALRRLCSRVQQRATVLAIPHG